MKGIAIGVHRVHRAGILPAKDAIKKINRDMSSEVDKFLKVVYMTKESMGHIQAVAKARGRIL